MVFNPKALGSVGQEDEQTLKHRLSSFCPRGSCSAEFWPPVEHMKGAECEKVNTAVFSKGSSLHIPLWSFDLKKCLRRLCANLNTNTRDVTERDINTAPYCLLNTFSTALFKCDVKSSLTQNS